LISATASGSPSMPPRNWSGRALPASRSAASARHAAVLVHRRRRNVRHDGDAGHVFQRVAHRGEARREELQAVVREQHDLRLAAEARADVGGRRIAQDPAGEILRRVQQRRRGGRHDGADIASIPHHLL
jgi:hypothetical protein